MIIVERFAGLVTNASPYALPPGAAATQVNIQVLSPGEAVVRGGVQAMSFTTHAASTSPVISMQNVQAGTLPTILYQDQAGQLYYARGPQ